MDFERNRQVKPTPRRQCSGEAIADGLHVVLPYGCSCFGRTIERCATVRHTGDEHARAHATLFFRWKGKDFVGSKDPAVAIGAKPDPERRQPR